MPQGLKELRRFYRLQNGPARVTEFSNPIKIIFLKLIQIRDF